ncbi:MAG: hypothetical protein HZC40_20775, partial [Chloroflexi bacterium]|nr:hypothetical protein [Chloroflexota bacterium]
LNHPHGVTAPRLRFTEQNNAVSHLSGLNQNLFDREDGIRLEPGDPRDAVINQIIEKSEIVKAAIKNPERAGLGNRSINTRLKISAGKFRKRLLKACWDTCTRGIQNTSSRASIFASSQTDGTCRQMSMATAATMTARPRMRLR